MTAALKFEGLVLVAQTPIMFGGGVFVGLLGGGGAGVFVGLLGGGGAGVLVGLLGGGGAGVFVGLLVGGVGVQRPGIHPYWHPLQQYADVLPQ